MDNVKGGLYLDLEVFIQKKTQKERKFKKENRTVYYVIISTEEFLSKNAYILWEWIKNISDLVRIIVLSDEKKISLDISPIPHKMIHLVLPSSISAGSLKTIAEQIFQLFYLAKEEINLNAQLEMSSKDMKHLSNVGQMLAEEHDFDKLVSIILKETKTLVNADAGSIYTIERKAGNQKPTHLRFKTTSLQLETDEFLLKIGKSSIAGYVALTGKPLQINDVYELTGKEDFKFNYDFDKNHKYRTKSMMVIPMKNHREEVVGVIQLINRKKYPDKSLVVENVMKGEVIPFSEKDFKLATALAGQASVAIQNNFLLQDIDKLFQGFVKASVTAIEQRDPTTSGHSFRVAEYSVGLASAVDVLRDGQYKNKFFTRNQIRELRYASLLHDFGKVGVKESVLLKAKKLYEHELEAIRLKYYLLRKSVNEEYLQKKIYLLESSPQVDPKSLKKIEEEKKEKIDRINKMHDLILKAVEPTVLDKGDFNILKKLVDLKVKLDTGESIPFLKNNEFLSLSITKGSLNTEERIQIQSHVSHTYDFLLQIPWTDDLKDVPEIAYRHHEKLNGTGYPIGLKANQISIQSRVMTIADIYDALTAPDRPYKASLPNEKAIDILKLEAKENNIDQSLLDIFVEAKIFEKAKSVQY